MKHFLILFGAFLLCVSLLLCMPPSSTSQALPEYAAQTGEPCSTCHLSPSGGGPRSPRGLAWVASGKPGTVPGLMQSLDLLGVKLSVDSAYYTATNSPVQGEEALGVTPAQSQKLIHWLSQYNGN